MKKLSIFGYAGTLALAVSALPLVSAHADKVAEEAARAAFENAKANCSSISERASQQQCLKQAEKEYQAALKEAAKQ